MRALAASSLIAFALSACAAVPPPAQAPSPPKHAECSEDWAPNVAECAVRCDARDAKACLDLGHRYAFGGVDRAGRLDAHTAQTYYAKGCALGSADACTAYVSNGNTVCGVDEEPACVEASLLLQAACDAGDATSVPCAALRQLVVETAPKICEAGDEHACAALTAPLGEACTAGVRDTCAALRSPVESLCRRANAAACVTLVAPFMTACRAGDTNACSAMAAAYGAGVRHACAEGSVADCAAACEAKNQAACLELARWYEDGHRVARDPARGVAIYRAVCDDTNGWMGCTELAQLYLPDCPPGESCLIVGGVPRGVPVDGRAALAYLQRACAGGVDDACADVWTNIANGSIRATPEEHKAALEGMCKRRGGEYCGMLKDLAAR